MRLARNILRGLSSRRLTAWMMILFALYYLTAAVWFGEAFGRYIVLISSNNLARVLYCIFMLNISLIFIQGLISLRGHPLRLILRAPLYLGIILFLLSSFLSINLRDSGWLLVGEGDVVSPPWGGGVYRIIRIEPALERNALRREGSPIFDYEPYVILMDDSGNMHRVGAFPALRVGSSYMHILKFGIAPVVELRDGDRVIASGPVALRLIPFGAMDSFDMKTLNYKFNLRMMPNRIVKDSTGEITRSYNIERPLYHIQVIRGDRTIFEGLAEDEIVFDDRVMRFYRPVFWVQLEVVHDPVYPFFITSLFMSISGLLLYPFSLFRQKK